MKRSLRLAASAATAGLLAACASAPLSFLDGQPRTRTDPLLYPVKVVSVDGGLEFRSPVQVEPGKRWITLEAAPSRSARGSLQRAFVFEVQPCTRYHLAARRSSEYEADWSLVVDHTEPVAGCDREVELKKAATAAERAR